VAFHSWNYRVIRSEHEDDVVHAIHEVFYNGQGEPIGWTEHAHPTGETLDELRDDIRKMFIACARPVLREDGDKLVEVEQS
jgi:CTP:molybdopterin cytidylyltransferase MocA